MKWNKKMAESLEAAFDCCWLLQDTLGNVIAGSDRPQEADEKYYNKPTQFIDWYLKNKTN